MNNSKSSETYSPNEKIIIEIDNDDEFEEFTVDNWEHKNKSDDLWDDKWDDNDIIDEDLEKFLNKNE